MQIVSFRKTQLCCDILMSIFCLISIANLLNVVDKFYYDMVLLIVGGISCVLCLTCGKKEIMKYAILFVISYTFCGLISFIYNGNMDIQELLWPIAYMGIGLLLVNFRISTSVTFIFFLSFFILLTAVIVKNGGVRGKEIIAYRNSISVYSLLFLSMHMISAYQKKESVSPIYPILMAAINFLAVGRSGCLTAILALMLFTLFSYQNGVSCFRGTKSMVIVIIIMIGIGWFSLQIYPNLLMDMQTGFEQRGLRSLRTSIWADYLAITEKNVCNVLFGSRIGGTEMLNEYSHNLHNSFFMLHAKYGIIGVMLVVPLLINAFWKLLKAHNMYLLTPLILLLFRMNFDYTNFNGRLDPIIIYYILYGGYNYYEARSS